MQQYFDIKNQYQDTLLLFQVGDFYELFFDDAKTASAYLAIALTSRGKNNGQDVPLCGIPIHAVKHYLKKLISGGFKVALCDQLTQPQPGTIVQRGVTHVFTPGTLIDSTMLDDKSASYLLSFYPEQQEWGLVFTELLTAQLFATHIPAGDYRMFEAELARFFPDEIVLPSACNDTQKSSSYHPDVSGEALAKSGLGSGSRAINTYLKKLGYCTSFADTNAANYNTNTIINNNNTPDNNQNIIQSAGDYAAGQPISKAWLDAQFSPNILSILQNNTSMSRSLDLLYTYLKKNQEKALPLFKTIQFYQPEDYLILDPATQKNLEIIKNNQDSGRKNTLLAVIDKAKTAMGSRMLKKWLLRPLIQEQAIMRRQDTVSQLHKNIDITQKLENYLSSIADLERIIGRIALKRAQIHDYLALKQSLIIIPEIKELLRTTCQTQLAQALQEKMGIFTDLIKLLEISLNDDSSQEHIIKNGFDHRLDHLRNLVENSQQELLKLEQKERDRTNINSLKISYNRVSGYYIEITNPNLDQVPPDYIEQQKLANRKRYVTQELKDLERDIFKAQNEIDVVENEVFTRVKDDVESYLSPLRNTAQSIAYLDALLSFALTAYHNNYCAPQFNSTRSVNIKLGRHPVIETTNNTQFIGNNTNLDNTQEVMLITGPNMGGKSTYLRQVALISILAQCGSFVPATSANVPIFDRIFTRIGSADNLAEGKSTFLVEMEETATICTQATKHSLVILDEVGRGTSTHDGIALAQAIIEYLVTVIQAKTLFATHYHELTELEQTFATIKNYHMLCKKIGANLHFLHTIAPGVAHRSFGLDVAKLAQLPDAIINRAAQILQVLHAQPSSLPTIANPALRPVPQSYEPIGDLTSIALAKGEERSKDQLKRTILEQEQKLRILNDINIDNLSPKQAFDIIWKLRSGS